VTHFVICRLSCSSLHLVLRRAVMLWHFVLQLTGLDLVELFANCPLLSQVQLDVVVESIAADLVAAEFVAVIVSVFVLVLVDFAADSAVAADVAVAAVGLDSEQLVAQAEEDPFWVVELVAVVFPLVNGVVGSSPHHPRQTRFCSPFFVSQF
jgi:hypothetical protein